MIGYYDNSANAMNETEIPNSKIERADMLKNILLARATGKIEERDMQEKNTNYSYLRSEFISDSQTRELLPRFVRTCRDLGAFWEYISGEAGRYAERRKIIREALQPLFDYLEARNVMPSDAITSDVLEKFDAEGVHDIWQKALQRRESDPEGAITVARTLLESICKHILDAKGMGYQDKDDLPKLYQATAKELNLSPSQHTEEAFKAILGGGMTLVNGIGTLRNRLSDAHGRGKSLPAKPASRHAHLAVNCAGAIAKFLIETYNEKA